MPAAAPGAAAPENQDMVFTPIAQLPHSLCTACGLESRGDGRTSGAGAALAASRNGEFIMNIVRYEPWHLMGRLHREIDQLFGDTFATSPAGGSTAATWLPSVDVHEEPERYTVHADLPGVEAKDIQVTADKGVLTIRGARRLEARESRKGFERLERSTGDFVRQFSLPENARADDIRARHNNGVLEVVIPKQPAAEPHRVNVEVN
jgi:HSP20 family protein